MEIIQNCLWSVKENEVVTVENFCEQLDINLQTRLSETGFAHGEKITCIKRLPIKGPSIYLVADGHYCLDKEVAEKIFIRREV